MKLSQVLGSLNQLEKSKFITCLDRLCSAAERSDPSIAKRLDKLDRQIRNASSGEITKLFNAVKPQYTTYVSEQISIAGPSISLLLSILTRDGNAVVRTSRVEQLYTKEWKKMDELAEELDKKVSESKPDDAFTK